MRIEQIIGRGAGGHRIECDCAQYATGDELQAMGTDFVDYKSVPMGQLYKCPYCNTFWARYHPGFGWRSFFKENDDAGACEAISSSASRVEVDAEKLQSLKKSILAMLRNISDYSTEDDRLVERYFAEENGKDYVNSVYQADDGTYTLFFAVSGQIKARMQGRTLHQATESIAITILDMKRNLNNGR